MSKTKIVILVLFLTLIGAILHFYNLNWGAPYYFHPDERNIASAVSRLNFPDQMNPQFFAYGSLPIYTIYFSGVLINILTAHQQPLVTNFDLAIQISRFYSALFSTLLIPLLFVIARNIATKQSYKNPSRAGLIAAFLTTSSVGFIQFAHFGTFEMWLTFFSILLFWICLQPLTKTMLLFIGILFGILIAIKVSSLALLVIFPLILFIRPLPSKTFLKKLLSTFRSLPIILLQAIIILLAASLIYIITNPFVLVDTKSFLDSMHYESNLAIGTLPVFYTGEFFNTIPVLFQFINIYPFLLNPLITILFIPSFCYLLFLIFKHKHYQLLVLTSFFLILFLSQAFLFAKWTRYMVPTLPFIYLIVALAISDIIANAVKQSQRLPRRLWLLAITLFFGINILFAFSYFITVFIRPDTRVEAYHYAQKTIPSETPILSEVYDMGIVPFNNSFTNISLFHFYDLDNDSPDVTFDLLEHQLSQNEYIILPSQRILKTRLIQNKKFPQGHVFYTQLLNGNLGYKKMHVTPCDIFCKITYLGDPVFRFEQTVNVFDRPTIMIFQKK
ncbi:MAG TPA: hypothetical protein VLF20_00190 [Patescibacteria group bacterium]|nr:hypothetical protein [Patescibacteria group bacterium]